MKKKKLKKAYKKALKNGLQLQEAGTAATSTAAGKGLFGNLPLSLPTSRTQQFLLGTLLGAAATYVLSNDELRAKMMKSVVKLYSGMSNGLEEMKEQIADIQAEMQAEGQNQA
jgi:hypothetical protein